MTLAAAFERTSKRSEPVTGAGRNLPPEHAGLDAVRTALDALAQGRTVILVDPLVAEHPGYLLAAAHQVEDAQVAFFVRHTSGVLCVPMAAVDCERLKLSPMVRHNESPVEAAFTVSVDAAAGGSTGISAADRAATIRLLADPSSTPEDFSRPGHVFPMRARPGGVLERARYTEAAVDLVRLAGAGSAAVISAVVSDDSTVVTSSVLADFAGRHALPSVTIPALVNYRQQESR